MDFDKFKGSGLMPWVGAGVGAGIGSFIPGVGTGAGAMGGMMLGQGLQNWWQQQSLLGYQKDLQQQIFAREDTGILRRVEDLKAAGLSPVLAAGSAAPAGSTVSTQAPQLDLKAAEFMSLLKMKQDISATEAQIGLIKANEDHVRNQMKIENEMLPSQIEQINAAALSSRSSAALNSANARKALIDAINAELTGIASNSSWSAIIRDLSGYSNVQLQRLLNEIRNNPNARNNPPAWLSPRWFSETPWLPPSWTEKSTTTTRGRSGGW